MYLSALFRAYSRSYIQKMIDRGQLKVNGEPVKKNIKLSPRDELELEITLESLKIIPENIPLDVVYEDENLVIINKDSGINVHPVPGEWWNSGTLVNALLYHCKQKLPSIGGVERPGIVHRLDKDTSGLIMVAKTDTMMQYLSAAIHDHQVEKYYIAIVSGIFPEDTFTVESYIGRHPTDRTKMTTVDPINPKLAVTHGTLLGVIDGKYSVLRLQLETGRTHQIRVHLASIGFPIIGDRVYGDLMVNEVVKKHYGLQRQALHAYELGIELYGEKRSYIWPLKPDMQEILGDLHLKYE